MLDETIDLVQTPRTVEDLGLSESLLADLVLRRTLADGKTSIAQLAAKLCLSHSVAESFATSLRNKKLVEFEGMVGRDYVIVLTEAGKSLANERMQACAYAGVAPVPLDQYRAVVAAQTPRLEVNRKSMMASFDDLVIEPTLVDELGPAMMSRGAIFLYGPPGTGKSSIAERMIRAYGDQVVVPRAVEVDGQIIMVFDPTVHTQVASQPSNIDKRWVLCERPCVIGGGELMPHMLDLSFDAKSGIYLAPLQMKANNGMFVVDDFGRQNMTPAQLLNRWIVPLDRRIDYLSLITGVKFEVPFNVKVVFSTNLPPAALGDEAFFRRLQSKVYIGSIDDPSFDEILRRVSQAQGIAVSRDNADYLRHLTRTLGDGDLRPYVPATVCEIVRMICAYEDRPLEMTREVLDRVAAMYFTNLNDSDDKPMSAVAASVPSNPNSGNLAERSARPPRTAPTGPPQSGARSVATGERSAIHPPHSVPQTPMAPNPMVASPAAHSPATAPAAAVATLTAVPLNAVPLTASLLSAVDWSELARTRTEF